MPYQRSALRNSTEILLVEDNPGDVRLLQEAFREANVTGNINVAIDGEEAIAYLRREGDFADKPRPALILLDLNLPRKTGREVLAEIKQERRLRRIPVVILSTSTSPDDIQCAYDLHANCYIQKPNDLETLVKLSRLLEGFWLKTAVLAM